jgi:hypothetical protein
MPKSPRFRNGIFCNIKRLIDVTHSGQRVAQETKHQDAPVLRGKCCVVRTVSRLKKSQPLLQVSAGRSDVAQQELGLATYAMPHHAKTQVFLILGQALPHNRFLPRRFEFTPPAFAQVSAGGADGARHHSVAGTVMRRLEERRTLARLVNAMGPLPGGNFRGTSPTPDFKKTE